MSGPSSQQLQLQGDQLAFYEQGMNEAKATFGEQQDLLKEMEAVYKPILDKGPNQEGFSAAEKSALDAQTIEGTARNFSAASRAVGQRYASDNPLPSGAEEQARGEVATAAAGEESREQTQVLEADYAQGLSEFENAGQALSVASGQLNPVAFESAATGAGSAAEQTASQINQEQNSWEAPVFGAIGALGGAALGNPKIFHG